VSRIAYRWSRLLAGKYCWPEYPPFGCFPILTSSRRDLQCHLCGLVPGIHEHNPSWTDTVIALCWCIVAAVNTRHPPSRVRAFGCCTGMCKLVVELRAFCTAGESSLTSSLLISDTDSFYSSLHSSPDGKHKLTLAKSHVETCLMRTIRATRLGSIISLNSKAN
jgi:hypothetical protein